MAKGMKGLKKLKSLPGVRRKKRADDTIGSLRKLKHEYTKDQSLSYIEEAVGDANLAQKLQKLREQYPAATVPELVAIHWLVRHNIRFLYQLNVRGGRVRQGGVIPDLVVFADPNALVWQINGNYWHTRPGAAERDARAVQLLLGQTIEGRRVIAVVALWERRLLADADSTCSAALMGIGIGQ